MVVASDPAYPIGKAFRDRTHYGFGCDMPPGWCGQAFPVVDKATGEVTWLGNLEGAERLHGMRRVRS